MTDNDDFSVNAWVRHLEQADRDQDHIVTSGTWSVHIVNHLLKFAIQLELPDGTRTTGTGDTIGAAYDDALYATRRP